MQSGGIVLVWQGTVYGWKNELRDPQHEQPGAIAVDPAGQVFIAEGGCLQRCHALVASMKELEEMERRWLAADIARKVAMRAALRDRMLWRDQLVNVVCGAIKAVCITVALGMVIEQIGLPTDISQTFAMYVTGPFLAFNPWAFFWRNLFRERANAAFDDALENPRQYLTL
jgi:hypothetical protein